MAGAGTLKAMGVAPASLVSPAAAAARNRREQGASVCVDTARAALAGFDRGSHVFGLTKGQFSMIDLVAAVLDQTGPAEVGLWTWCIADYEVETMTALLVDQRVTGFRLVMDYAGVRRDNDLIADMQEHFGSDCVRVTMNHAKIVTVSNAEWRVAIRGSMNLNMNTRFEQFDVSEGDAAFDVITGIMDEMWAKGPPLPVAKTTLRTAADLLLVGPAPTLPDWGKTPTRGADWWRPR